MRFWTRTRFSPLLFQAFFAEHSEYAKNDFYITGESYAGHYIPAFASRVHQGNKNNEGIHIKLKVNLQNFHNRIQLHLFYVTLFYFVLQGFAIGNGLTDPAIQYKAYTDYALDMGIIKESDYKRINKIYPACKLAIKLCGKSDSLSLISISCFCYLSSSMFVGCKCGFSNSLFVHILYINPNTLFVE